MTTINFKEFNAKLLNRPWFAISVGLVLHRGIHGRHRGRLRVPDRAERHSGGPVFHVFHMPQCLVVFLTFMIRAHSLSVGDTVVLYKALTIG